MSDRPPFQPAQWELIELATKQVDAGYWKVLKSQQIHYDGPETLSPAKTPALLLNKLEMYAGALFRAEGDQYPKKHSDYREWLTALSGRIIARILRAIDEVDATNESPAKLSYHGLSSDAAREGLERFLAIIVNEYVGLSSLPQSPPPVLPLSTSEKTTVENNLSATDSEVARRSALLAEYKAATRNISNKRIYEARNSKIHKPEFYRWLSGNLPANATPTLNFERFLREKKLPIPRQSKS
jgi:hypothetical protein